MRSAPAAQVEQCLTHPVLCSSLLDSHFTDECINLNPNLDPARKSAILGDLYRHLLQKEYGLYKAKSEVASVWFASLSDAEKGEIISLGYTNASNAPKMVEIFGELAVSASSQVTDVNQAMTARSILAAASSEPASFTTSALNSEEIKSNAAESMVAKLAEDHLLQEFYDNMSATEQLASLQQFLQHG